MSKQSTPKKRAFLMAYRSSGDVKQSALKAGYTQAGTAYRYLKVEDGQYVDPIARSVLGTPDAPAPGIPAATARVLQLVPGGKDVAELNIGNVRAMLWEISQDTHAAASNRVQALSILLKDLKEDQEPEEQSVEEILETIKLALGVSE